MTTWEFPLLHYHFLLTTEVGKNIQRYCLSCHCWDQQWHRSPEQTFQVQVPPQTKVNDSFTHHQQYHWWISSSTSLQVCIQKFLIFIQSISYQTHHVSAPSPSGSLYYHWYLVQPTPSLLHPILRMPNYHILHMVSILYTLSFVTDPFHHRYHILPIYILVTAQTPLKTPKSQSQPKGSTSKTQLFLWSAYMPWLYTLLYVHAHLYNLAASKTLIRYNPQHSI